MHTSTCVTLKQIMSKFKDLSQVKLKDMTVSDFAEFQTDVWEIPRERLDISDEVMESMPLAFRRILERDDLVPLKYSWDWTRRRYRDRAADFYFRVDGKMIPLFFVQRNMVPHLPSYLFPSNINVSPTTESKPMGKLWGIAYFSQRVEGPPGFAHGGSIATFLDQILGLCVNLIHLPKGTKNPCRTLKLEVTYQKGVKLGSILRYYAWVERSEGRKHWVKSRLIDEEQVSKMGGHVKAEDAPWLVEANGLFVQPRLDTDNAVETGPSRKDEVKAGSKL